MHQPVYKDARTGIYMLPWVRMHAAKDYADMVQILDEFPDVRVTFNLVPCLLEQIEDYAGNPVRDSFLEVSSKAPESLSDDEKRFLLRNFFTANKKHAIGRYPHYYRLYRRTQILQQEISRRKGLGKFTAQEIVDLQTFFNLAWIDPSYLNDPDIGPIVKKGSNFTVAERDAVIKKQMAVVAGALGAWRAAKDRGQIEISSSAYFHPILPLLCDVAVAREALPGTSLPRSEIKWPEDALAQLEDAVTCHQRLFGAAPRGLWPPEGGVSEEALGLARRAGFEWAAADEDILTRSLGIQKSGRREVNRALSRPYSFDTPSGPISLVFRDRVLSDLIGFTYMNWAAEAAVKDFIGRLERIGQTSEDDEPLVTVVLDGENCWEFYENDGRDFLRLLYKELASHPTVRTTTPSEYLGRFPVSQKLRKVPAGSWIDSNFRIWVGHAEDNAAWDLLAEARTALKKYVESHPESEGTEAVSAAWREIHVAEGSDWFWWYGDEHSSVFDFEFDSLFRNHLIRVYELLRLEVPARLYAPILGAGGTKPQIISAPPGGFLEPRIDGKVTDYYEWRLGGYCDLTRGASSMRQASSVVRALYYGYDSKNMYVRIDTVAEPASQSFAEVVLVFEITSPVTVRFSLPLGPKESPCKLLVERRVDSHWEEISTSAACAMVEIVEVALPLKELGLAAGDRIDAFLLVTREQMVVESWPAQEKLSFQIPWDECETSSWTA
jgi:alpha-amylase/alpha-mannosidase (GH57 family)